MWFKALPHVSTRDNESYSDETWIRKNSLQEPGELPWCWLSKHTQRNKRFSLITFFNSPQNLFQDLYNEMIEDGRMGSLFIGTKGFPRKHWLVRTSRNISTIHSLLALNGLAVIRPLCLTYFACYSAATSMRYEHALSHTLISCLKKVHHIK